MSEWMKIRTAFELAHLDCLVTALGRVRPQLQGHVEANPAGVEMRDYHRKAATAQVVVRRAQAGGYGDLGFVAQADGSLTLVADDGHRREGGLACEATLRALREQYDFAKVEQAAGKGGYELARTVEPSGRWRVELTKRAVPQALIGRAW